MIWYLLIYIHIHHYGYIDYRLLITNRMILPETIKNILN